MNNCLLTDPHQRKLLKKWAPILESGTPIQSESTKVALAQILENTRNFYIMKGMVNEAGVSQADIIGSPDTAAKFGPTRDPAAGIMTGTNSYPYAPGAYGDYYLPNVVMPMLRRIMPDLLANELVAVQPLNGPVGFALAYRPQLGPKHNKWNTSSDIEIGYNPTDTRWTGKPGAGDSFGVGDVTADTEYWGAYGGDQWLGEGIPTEEAEWMDLNDETHTYPTVTFGLVRSTVEAKTRKLAAHWTPELAEDMQTMHGIDVEREMVNTLTYEVGAEIDRQIVTEMVKAAIVGGSVSKWTPISADGLDQMGRLATLLTQITINANNIAIRTKRGNANFVITTPRVCALLQQMAMNKFTSFKSSAAIPTVPDTGVGALAKIGLINDDQQLLIRDAHVQALKNDYILMGYKGKQAGDSGIIYCPYIPLQLAKVMQPGSFTPSIGARTRYGIMSNPWDAKNYYHFMKLTDMTTKYTWGGDRHFIEDTAAPTRVNIGGGDTVMPPSAP